jgi:hypothetical protein
MGKNIIKLTQVIHFDEDDKTFGGDYFSVELKDENGKVIAAYGDCYHDKGAEKVEGFIAGVEWAARRKVNLVTERIADGQT